MLSNTRHSLAPLINGKVGLIVNPSADREVMHHMTAWLAQRGPVSVIDCGCGFNASLVMELIHLETIFFKEAMDRIQVARAFTAYQFMTLLAQTPAGCQPQVIMYPLHLFYDDNIRLPEATRLFAIFIEHLIRLSRKTPLVVCARPPSADFEERLSLLNRLTQLADQMMVPLESEIQGTQLRLPVFD